MKLEPSTLVTLYEINLDKKIDGARYFFHAGENGYGGPIQYQGNEYYYHPITVQGFNYVEKELPRPTLTADNTDSFFSLKTRFFDDFIGYEFVRIRTFVKFLSNANFPNNVNPFGTGTEESFPNETYVINKKMSENSKQISFELTSPLDKEGGEIPSRKVVFNVCQWRYRHAEGCGYNAAPVANSQNVLFVNPPTQDNANPPSVLGNDFRPGGLQIRNRGEYNSQTIYSRGDYVSISPDAENDPTQIFMCVQNNTQDIQPGSDKTRWVEDACSKNIAGCRLRFGGLESANDGGLPFGGFPGSWPK